MSKFKSIPQELRGVLNHLIGDGKLAAFKTWPMGWIAAITFRSGNRDFRLVSDSGYINAYDISFGKEQDLFPPEDQRLEISPSQVAALMQTALRTG